MLRVLRFDPQQATSITQFDSVAASAVHLGAGHGEAHVYAVHLAAGGEIGFHPAGYGQLFILVEGEGWVATPDDRVDVVAGEAVRIEKGTMHAKGTASGLVAVMVQIRDLENPDSATP